MSQIEELKLKAENIAKAFNETLTEISKLGFKFVVNKDQTLYIWKDIREEYGTRPVLPRPEKESE